MGKIRLILQVFAVFSDNSSPASHFLGYRGCCVRITDRCPVQAAKTADLRRQSGHGPGHPLSALLPGVSAFSDPGPLSEAQGPR